MQGLSLYSTGARAVGVVGGLVAGVLSDHAGPPVALFASAAVLGIAATVMLTVSATRRSERRMKEKFLHQTLGGLRAMSTNPAVATLLVMAIVVEIFGFAYQAVLPSVARDVLHVKATGYGSLTFMAGVGAMAGVAGLTLLGNYPRKSRLVLLIVFGFGVSMLAFSASTSLPLSLVLILGIGAAMGMFDTMQWTLLQANVADEMRGRAVAAWVFAIGFGWIGHLLLGALAEGAGVRWALAGSGVMLIATGVAAIYVFRRVRIE
jgi:MFS family permease